MPSSNVEGLGRPHRTGVGEDVRGVAILHDEVLLGRFVLHAESVINPDRSFLAEYFAAFPRERRRRSIQFVGTPGHHNIARVGIEWIEDNADAVLDKTALLINAEHTGAVDLYMLGNRFGWSNRPSALMWGVSGRSALSDIATDAYETFGVSTLVEAGGPVGEISPLQEMVPAVWLIDAPEFFHSDHETAATVPAGGIEAVTRAFAKIIDEVNDFELEELQRR